MKTAKAKSKNEKPSDRNAISQSGGVTGSARPSNFPNKEIRPGSFWLVLYEHRPNVIRIAPDRSGFFAPGQEELWPLTEVQAWLREIIVVEGQMTTGEYGVEGVDGCPTAAPNDAGELPLAKQINL